MKSDRRVPVAIIGGGFSGTILAAQLARRGIASALIDGSGRLGKGVAYSTTEPAHLLNVRAEGMSAWAGEPGPFCQALRGRRRRPPRLRRSGGCSGAISAKSSTRRWPAATPSRSPPRRSRATATNGGWRVALDDGTADRAPSAGACRRQPGTGAAAAPSPASAIASSAIRGAPTPASRASDLAADGERTRCWSAPGSRWSTWCCRSTPPGIAGKIVALVAARPHPARARRFRAGAGRARRGARRQSARALCAGSGRRSAEVGWRAAVDSLRPHSQSLWQSLDSAAAAALPAPCARRGGTCTATASHRRSRDTIARLIGEGRLEIVAGRIIPRATRARRSRSTSAAAAPASPDDALRLRLQLHRPAACHRAHQRSAAAQPARCRAGSSRPSRHWRSTSTSIRAPGGNASGRSGL